MLAEPGEATPGPHMSIALLRLGGRPRHAGIGRGDARGGDASTEAILASTAGVVGGDYLRGLCGGAGDADRGLAAGDRGRGEPGV